ncbi:TetR/AcrR family transcriptional regulator [Saccharothrix isguenensis]
MPTISEDTQLDRQKIIQAAVTCFIAQGVPVASMEDIVTESGLPGDVVHSHFAGKNDILRALGAMNKAAASGVLREILRETTLPPADEVVNRVAVFFETSVRNGDPVGIAPQAWGVAIYDAEVNAIMREVFTELREVWVELATRMAAEGRLPDGADPEDVGRTFFSIVLGFMLQSLLGDVKADHLRRALRALLR